MTIFRQASIVAPLPKEKWLRLRSDSTVMSTCSQYEAVPEALLTWDPWRNLPPDAHKYTRGHILVIGGSSGKTGAPVMAALSALRSGAGWATVSIPENHIPVDRPVPWDLTLEPLYEGQSLSPRKLKDFVYSRNIRAIVIGPGWMMQHINTQTWDVLQQMVENGIGLVIDAGALQHVLDFFNTERPANFTSQARVIATPHPGEWKTLQHKSSYLLPVPSGPDERQTVQTTCRSLGITLVYKGANPIVFGSKSKENEEIAPFACNHGSNVLSKAGTGDITSGVIAAHLAIGCSTALASARGFTVVAEAGRKAADQYGRDALIPTDLIDWLGKMPSSTSVLP